MTFDNSHGKGDWRPTASRQVLAIRAGIIRRIRQFFEERGVLEVETPVLCSSAVSHPEISLFATESWEGTVESPEEVAAIPNTLYLQPSPEGPMKRLVAAGCGSIFQICKAFRKGESSPNHNPEFTMLEWYRSGFDLVEIMDEVEMLLQYILGIEKTERLEYAFVFKAIFGEDPLCCDCQKLRSFLSEFSDGRVISDVDDRDVLLETLFEIVIQPRLGQRRPTFVYNYPASQASLGKIVGGEEPKALRFELFIEGLELAHGYIELEDSGELCQRLLEDEEFRAAHDLPSIPRDDKLVAALREGFPECAGVAIGVDRLVMLAVGARSIDEVIAFPVDRS